MKAMRLSYLALAMLLGCLLLPAAMLGPARASAGEPQSSASGWLLPLPLQQARLIAADGSADDNFGAVVALDDQTALVGVPQDSGARGAAYVFVRAGQSWSLQAKLTAADGASGDQFGLAVALLGDLALVGAPYRDGDQGGAYVFVRSGTTWSQQGEALTVSAGAANERLGMSVALSGETALLGAPGQGVDGRSYQGAAYVFVRSGTIWSQQGEALTASDGAANDFFGNSVALSGDSALVGTSAHDAGAGEYQGAAYVFVRSGTAWTQETKLTAADGAAYDFFGTRVALSGETALVGAPAHDVAPGSDQGAAYVFVRSGAVWTQQQQLTAADAATSDHFGTSVALAGGSAVVGSLFRDLGATADQGAAYVFARSDATWSQQGEALVGDDSAANDRFGVSVALSGQVALIGAPYHDVEGRSNQGAAYVFVLEDTTAPLTTVALSPSPNAAGWNKDPVTVIFTGADSGSGVDQTFYRIGDAGDYLLYDAAARPAIAANGQPRVWYYSTDLAGNAEAPKSRTVRIDTTKPVTRALYNATVYRGRRATLRLRVNDTFSPKATVTVKIYRRGVLKKTLKLGKRYTSREIRYTGYTCWLARGSYIWKVYATDLAGNTQKLPVGYKTLAVR